MKQALLFAALVGIVSSNAAPPPQVLERKVLLSDVAAARFLDQATWGPTTASIAQLQGMGISRWLNWQMDIDTSDLPDQPILNSAGHANTDLTPVESVFFQNAVTGPDQLRQRVAFALTQIWVVSELETTSAYAFPPYWRIFRDGAFGNYRDLIRAVTLNPAMGRYLNMANNNKANPAKGTAANENYARESMQLFTLGLNQLNPGGSAVLDGSGNAVPTFGLIDVTNLAKAFTGWTYPTAPGATAKANNPAYYIGEMFAVEAMHDTSAKTIIGNTNIPAGQTAEQDLESVLDALMAQPTMAPFVSQQLIQHLVTSNPSPAYIARVSNIFLNNGSGVRGDLRAVVQAILTDPEARAGDDAGMSTDASFGHLREPILFLANLLRGLNVPVTSQNTGPANYASAMDQPLFHAPSVFSYFSPQYRISDGLLAPEFQINSTQTAVDRADAVSAVLYSAIDSHTKADLTPYLANASDTDTLLDQISQVFLHHTMSSDLHAAASQAANAASTSLKKVQAALFIVLTSSEYQIIH